MDEDDFDRSCPQCRMDRVVFSNLLRCILVSFRNMYIDIIVKRRPVLTSLGRDDRVYYVVGAAILLMTLQLVVC